MTQFHSLSLSLPFSLVDCVLEQASGEVGMCCNVLESVENLLKIAEANRRGLSPLFGQDAVGLN